MCSGMFTLGGTILETFFCCASQLLFALKKETSKQQKALSFVTVLSFHVSSVYSPSSSSPLRKLLV